MVKDNNMIIPILIPTGAVSEWQARKLIILVNDQQCLLWPVIGLIIFNRSDKYSDQSDHVYFQTDHFYFKIYARAIVSTYKSL